MANDVSDVKIPENKIMLYSFDRGKSLNIYNLVRSFDIYESLENYTVQADFYIAEGIELLNNFPVGGEEIIEVTFQTPDRDSITYKFFIENIEGITSNDQSNMKSYKLHCVTKDFLRNAFTVFSKRYTDLKYHEALSACIKNDMGAEVPLMTIEQTKGKFDYVVNNVRPFQVVDLIKERAVSAEDNKSSVFVFYQDNKGYHFQTIEKLIKERKGGAKAKEFYYDTANRASPYEQVINIRNILSYTPIQQGSSVNKVLRGTMRNQFREFDISSGLYYAKQEYVNSSDQMQYQKTDDSNDQNSAAYNSFTSQRPAVTRMLVKDGLRPEMEHNKNVHLMRPFVEKMSQYQVRIRVYGDTSLRVGDIIKLNIPEISGTTGNQKQAEIFSENYIVVNLKHRLDQRANGLFEHFVVMDCAKPNQYGRPLG